MMASTPFLYCINTDDDFVEQAGCGITVQNPIADSVAEAALGFFDLPLQVRKKMGKNGHHAAIYRYEYQILTRLFLDTINDLFQR